MHTSRVVPILLAAGTLAGLSAFSAPAPDRGAVYRALAGTWEGTLTYKDYTPPNRMVILPTRVTVSYTPDSSAVLIDYTYDDGPGKVVKDRDRFALNAAETVLEWDSPGAPNPRLFAVDSIRDGAAKGQLVVVATTEADDDNAPATLRETLTIGTDELRILKTVRPTGGTFQYRHEYVLRRAP